MDSIPDDLFKMWLLDEAMPNFVTIQIGTTYVQFLPYNPMRFALILGANSAQSFQWQFGDSLPTNTQGVFSFSAGQQSVIVTFDQIGQVIRYPLWAKAGAASIAGTCLEVSYNPARWSKAMRMINEYISRHTTS